MRYHFIVKDIFAQQLLDGNQQILAFFVKKSLYNLVNWSYFHIFASRRVSLKERNIFCIPFPTEFLCRKEGLCRGWTQKDENR
ncbi:hypothetical protein F3F36_21160 [Bacteroides ovatus]|nr:hypothetical protein F3F36_21160 [Bacteroides ovatus]KAA3830649.1 hypothetical protein F3F35_15820 [Bacteroides ovatus]KAA3854464.1 hypothetical protein F3F29_23595 [Bacteroides ovatus]KAA3885262.1 hypothetical protein F3F32_23015 [Bacteroides ovatus]KAA3887454.1 hypothetical protein F3F59_20825 [Bacteroides ovatus]